MFTAALFTIARKWKQPKQPSADEWISEMWSIHVAGHYSHVMRSEALIHAATRGDAGNITPRKRSQPHKARSRGSTDRKCPEQAKLMETESGLTVARGWRQQRKGGVHYRVRGFLGGGLKMLGVVAVVRPCVSLKPLNHTL